MYSAMYSKGGLVKKILLSQKNTSVVIIFASTKEKVKSSQSPSKSNLRRAFVTANLEAGVERGKSWLPFKNGQLRFLWEPILSRGGIDVVVLIDHLIRYSFWILKDLCLHRSWGKNCKSG